MSDERVAERARVGDQRAFEVIFERYHQELYRYCMAILSNPDDARDALQSTMAAALRSLPGDERQIDLRPWLYRIAHNEAISIVRRRSPLIEPDEIEETLALGTEGEAETRERLRQLVADLRSLPERQRGALVMRELSGLSYGEISEAMGASEGTARQAVYEARSALREIARGREMDCDEVCRAVSDHDGRVLRGRRIRAHLRSCTGCRDFRDAIGQRRSDLHTICPRSRPPRPQGFCRRCSAAPGPGRERPGGHRRSCRWSRRSRDRHGRNRTRLGSRDGRPGRRRFHRRRGGRDPCHRWREGGGGHRRSRAWRGGRRSDGRREPAARGQLGVRSSAAGADGRVERFHEPDRACRAGEPDRPEPIARPARRRRLSWTARPSPRPRAPSRPRPGQRPGRGPHAHASRRWERRERLVADSRERERLRERPRQ